MKHQKQAETRNLNRNYDELINTIIAFYRPRRPRDTTTFAGNLQKPLPFQHTEYNQKRQLQWPKQSRTGPTVKDRYRENSRSLYSESRLSHGNPGANLATRLRECDAQTISSGSSLTSWKRQLKTCVESNARDKVAKSETELSTKSTSDRILSLRRQQAWYSDNSSAKCYKILNYQNSTLASICVQGRDPPVKMREATARLRSPSTSTSLVTQFVPSSVENKNSFSALTDELSDCNFMTSPNDETMSTTRLSSSTTETDQELPDDDDVMQDDVFSQDDVTNEKTDTSDQICDGEATEVSNFDLLNLNFSKDEAEDSDNESDISQQEMSSDEEDGITDPIQTDERSRRVVEKYKELYKNENMAENNNLDFSHVAESPKTKEKHKDLNKKRNKFEKNKESQTYEFAPVLPKQFDKYSLSELSVLPHDVNWRDVIKSCDLCPDRRPWKKDGCVAKQRRIRINKAKDERNKMESFVDRLLCLEKLQTTTRRTEFMNRYHVAHVRATAAAARLKAQNAKPSANSTNNDNAKQNESTSDSTSNPNPRTSSRRRSSVPLASARLAWANQITQGEHMKEAHRSGDFSAVIDNWSAKNRPTKNNSDKGRRSSDCSIKKPRSRWMHPRFYDYHWSEKSKDDNIRPTSYWGSRIRSCSTCKEKWRSIASTVVQERRRRPR